LSRPSSSIAAGTESDLWMRFSSAAGGIAD
jgi:hypothetical protein